MIRRDTCTLEDDINKCPFFEREMRACSKNNEKCGFYKDEEIKTAEKKEKWFEKYYR